MTNFMYPYFTSGGVTRTNAKERFNGHTVRPVSEYNQKNFDKE